MAGSVITFYSYKGGVGRSFALANVAVILAQWGYRVLAVDWDIEAPGLHHYFSGSTPQLSAGVLDFISACEHGRPVVWKDYAVAVAMSDASERLFLMPSASGGGVDYTSGVQALDWESLYRDHDFGQQLEALRAQWIEEFDFILVDSRTGVTDFSGVTTVQLPDILAFLFTANNQSLEGCCEIARRAMHARTNMPVDRPALLPVPIPARFDNREEYDRAQTWKARFTTELAPFLDVWVPLTVDRSRLIDLMTIPYVPRWTFGEELCAVAEPAGTDGIRTPGQGASFAIETLSSIFANGFDKVDLLASSRDEFVHLARSGSTTSRAGSSARIKAFISAGSASTDQEIARELRRELQNNGFGTFYPPQDLLPDNKYHIEIRSELEQCDALILILNNGDIRTQSMQTEEFLRNSLRIQKRRPIIPIISSPLTNEFENTPLADFQKVTIDVDKGSLSEQMSPILERLFRLRTP